MLPRLSHPRTPGSPSPTDGTPGVSATPTLSWNASGATSYDVQFGATNPPPQVATGQTTGSYTPAPLAPATTYYWQIIARNNYGAATGPVWSFTTLSATSDATDIVVFAADIPSRQIHGSWTTMSDVTSPNGLKLATPDAGWSTTNAPLVAPADYVDVMFDADAGIPYTLWLRMCALNDNKYNDALWVQFSDALVANAPVYPLNSTSGLLVNLATDVTAVEPARLGMAERGLLASATGDDHVCRQRTAHAAHPGAGRWRSIRSDCPEPQHVSDGATRSPHQRFDDPPAHWPAGGSRFTKSRERSGGCEHDSHSSDVERNGRDELRRAVWQQQPAAAGCDGNDRGVIRLLLR